MNHTAAARLAPRLALATLTIVGAAIVGPLGDPSGSPPAAAFHDVLPGDQQRALGDADGLVLDGVSVFDGAIPAVANLEAGLLEALRRAAADAAEDGVAFQVTSGWRSAEYQAHLFREAVAAYGSEDEAARWVAPADTSAHVSGEAVDIGPVEATAWLSEHGARYGLCQIYRNEPWHYELRPKAIGGRCPRMYADTAHDPRMQR